MRMNRFWADEDGLAEADGDEEELEIIEIEGDETPQVYDVSDEAIVDVDALIRDSIKALSISDEPKAPLQRPVAAPVTGENMDALPAGETDAVRRLMRMRKADLAGLLLVARRKLREAEDSLQRMRGAAQQLRSDVACRDRQDAEWRRRLEEVENQNAILLEYKERAQRLSDEFQRYQARIRQDRQESNRFANRELIRELLPAIDSLDIAMNAEKTSPDTDGFKAGLLAIKKQFINILSSQGLEPIEAERVRFDPRIHEAMMMVHTRDIPDRHVVEELRKGYLMHGSVLRPAMVTVASHPESPPAVAGQSEVVTDDDVHEAEVNPLAVRNEAVELPDAGDGAQRRGDGTTVDDETPNLTGDPRGSVGGTVPGNDISDSFGRGGRL
ncbi:nucleotide exchange factor GrpE [bacterium]|nr:nucleotide exchange factor GrpE [candidate division CSSED10-310 bacterium]